MKPVVFRRSSVLRSSSCRALHSWLPPSSSYTAWWDIDSYPIVGWHPCGLFVEMKLPHHRWGASPVWFWRRGKICFDFFRRLFGRSGISYKYILFQLLYCIILIFCEYLGTLKKLTRHMLSIWQKNHLGPLTGRRIFFLCQPPKCTHT